MDDENVALKAAFFIDEFVVNFSGKTLALASEDPVDKMIIQAMALDGLIKLQENGDNDTFSLVFGVAVALGAFLQYKGRFDIMKLRGTIQ